MRTLTINRDIRDAACVWLRANGVDPSMTPMGPVQINDEADTITVGRFTRDQLGNPVIHKCCDGSDTAPHYAQPYLTVPLVEPLPAELAPYVVAE